MTNETAQLRMGELGGNLVNELIERGLPPSRMLYRVGGGWIIRVRKGPLKGGITVEYLPTEDKIIVTATNWWGRRRAQASVAGASSCPDAGNDVIRAVESIL
jgi:hypothetical protein